MWPAPITFTGNHIRLVPLTQDHAAGLKQAVADGELYKLWYTGIPEPDKVETEIARRLQLQEEGHMLPFTILHADRDEVMGWTTYMNIDATAKRVEIGSTFYRKSAQRTAANTEAKLLLLTHAFEALHCIAVELRTHALNRQSRNGIERLGAKLDGILRNHSRMHNGTLRDTAVYSITDYDWPAVKANLVWQLERPRD